MKKITLTLIAGICFFIPLSSPAQQPTVSTFAGTGISGFIDGDVLTQAQFSFPIGVGVCVGTNGVIYVADRGNHAIRKIESGNVTTIAGNGTSGYVDATGVNARFNFPTDINVDANGNIYVTDFGNCVVRKVTQSGVVTTLAGSGSCGFQNGSSSTAKFFGPHGVVVDNIGNVYVSEAGNHVIRKIDTNGTVSTYAGQFNSFASGYLDGPASTARFARPTGLVFDNAGNLYVAEEDNHTIRKVSSSLIVSTIAGVNNIGAGSGNGGFLDGGALTQAEFNSPTDVTIDNSGNIYVTDQDNHRIRKIASGNVTTFAGGGPVGPGNGGFADGLDTIARFNEPFSICHDDSSNLFVADLNNHRIRLIGLPPPPLSLEATTTHVSCNGLDGAIDLTVMGGTLPYTFQWSNGAVTEDINSLSGGSYFVTVFDGVGDSIADSTEVIEPGPDNTSASQILNTPLVCTGVYFSEYIEGSANNQALELFNAGRGCQDLSKYSIKIFKNAQQANPDVIPLNGMLGSREVFICGNDLADPAIINKCDFVSSSFDFDGRDAIGLYKNDTLIDIIGEIGFDPGNGGWQVVPGFTKDNTLKRKYDVRAGSPFWSLAQTEYEVLPMNMSDSLGEHKGICALVTIQFLKQETFMNEGSTKGIVLSPNPVDNDISHTGFIS